MGEQPDTTPGKKPRMALLLATGFGLGYLPLAPGTWGSLAGLALGWFFANFWLCVHWLVKFASQARYVPFVPSRNSLEGLLPYVIGTAFFTVAGVSVARLASVQLQSTDPHPVVIDEISGQMISLLPVFITAFTLERGWKYVVMGFILFRVFDIWKPWPIRRAEKLPGGWGIMADDWLAGIYAAVVLWVARALGWLG